MSLMLEPAREGGLKLQKHIGEVLIGVGEADRPSCPTLSACFPDFRLMPNSSCHIGNNFFNICFHISDMFLVGKDIK